MLIYLSIGFAILFFMAWGLFMIQIRSLFWMSFIKVDGLMLTMRRDQEIIEELLSAYGKVEEKKVYSTILINEMTDFRNEHFRDTELVTKFDEIIRRWRSMK